MEEEQKEALRERNRRRAHACPKCGQWARDMTDDEKRTREDVFETIRYRICDGCGNVWPVKARR